MPKIIIVFFLLSINKISASEIYQWDEAHNHIGETVTVEGIFKYTNNIGNICFLNFHPNFEKYISVLIFKEYFSSFPKSPETFYYLKKVKVHGTITSYNGKPQIEVKSPRQIKVVGEYERQKAFPPCKCNYPEQLEITAINIGQGDATLIATPSKIMLVDAGESFWHSNEDALKIDSVIREKYGDNCRCIDYLLISHFHVDHIGYIFIPETPDDFPLNKNLKKLKTGESPYKPLGYGGLGYLVLEKGYQIGKMFVRDFRNHNPNKSPQDNGSKTFRNWKIILESYEGKKQFHPVTAKLGKHQIQLGEIEGQPVIVDIIAVDGATPSNLDGCDPCIYFDDCCDTIRGNQSENTLPPSENDLSISFILSFGDFQMYIGGDTSGENYVSEYGYKYHDVETCLAADPIIRTRYGGHLEILRVNHHGSSHSTNQFFLNTFDPKVAICSVGDHNTYGHVNPMVLDRTLELVAGKNSGKVFMTECGDNAVTPSNLCTQNSELCAIVADKEYPEAIESDEVGDKNVDIFVSLDGTHFTVEEFTFRSKKAGVQIAPE